MISPKTSALSSINSCSTLSFLVAAVVPSSSEYENTFALSNLKFST